MAVVNLFVVFSVLIFCLFILGLHNFITNHEANKCQMTYMFEYPQYVKISFGSRQTQQYQRYGLYAYGEGQFTEKLRKMSFSGIPVLFIPGNSGSFKQVRSLASVSLRKAISSHSPYHFDFFAVDLNEEYSALYGGILDDQTEFVHLSIKRILQLYASASSPPKSVVLIGHSMGGMVARGLFLGRNFDRHLVRVIVTLATPHKQPVLALDPHISRYYHDVNSYWDANRATNLSHVTFVSIGGGHRDMLVRSDLTHSQQADLNVLTTAMSGVWLSTDHLCSVWCKELVIVVVRTLFDLVDVRAQQVSRSARDRKAAFHYHMVHRTAGKRLVGAFHPPVAAFDVKGEWRESLLRQYSVELKDGVHVPTHFMVRLLDDPKHELLAVEAVNLSDKDWIFACQATTVVNNVRMCESGVNLSNWTHISPSVRYKRKFVSLNMTLLRQQPFTHVILRVLPTDDPVQLNVDVHSSGRHMTLATPHWLLPSEHTILESTDDRALHYSIKFPGLERAWQAYRLFVTPIRCKRAAHHAVASFKVGWRREDVHAYITDNASEVLHLRLHTPKPSNLGEDVSPWVDLTLDSACKYSVRVSGSLVDTLGQLARFYSSMLWPYVAGILVLAVRHQLRSAGECGRCVMFHSALVAGAQPQYVLPVILLFSRLLSWDAMAGVVPGPDMRLLQEQGLAWVLLPVVLYAVAFSLVYLLGIGCWLAVIFSGHTIHKMALRFLARSLVGSLSLSEWALAALNKLPAAVASFLLILCFTSCGALGLGVASSFYFLKLCKMYDEYLEDLFKSSLKLILKGKKKSADADGGGDGGSGGEVQEACTEDEETGDGAMQVTAEDGDGATQVTAEDGNGATQVIAEEGDGSRGAGDVSAALPAPAEDAVVASSCEADDGHPLSELHFSFTMLLLLVALTTVNIPCVLTWAHNFRYSAKLRQDPSFLISATTCACLGILWQITVPKPRIKHYPVVSHLLYWLAVVTFLYAPVSLYRLSPLVAAVFAVVTLHQVLAGRHADHQKRD